MNSDADLEYKNNINSILKLSGKDKLNAILEHAHPLKVVQKMPITSLLVLFNEVGKESCLLIFEMLSKEQLKGIFDFEIWSKDRLNILKVKEYFSLLFAADHERAVKQIYDLDIELIGLLLKLVGTIYDTSLNEDPEELNNIYYVSPDGRFIVSFKDDRGYETLSHCLKQFLDALYERDAKFVIQLLEQTRFELASSLEEEAFRLRNIRLSEIGILPFEERLSFFSPLSKLSENKKTKDIGLKINIFADDALEEYAFLMNPYENISEEKKSQILKELVYSIQNIHMDLSGDFGDFDKIKNTSAYVKTLIDLTILESSGGDQKKAYDLLLNSSIKDLIRVGRTKILIVKKYINNLLDDQTLLIGKNFIFLDSPLREVAIGLNKNEPLYYEGLLDVKKLTYRYFSKPEELYATIQALSEIKFRSRLLGLKGIGITCDEVKEFFKKNEIPSQSHIFARFLINSFLKKEQILSKIDEDFIYELYISKNDYLRRNFNDHSYLMAEKISIEKAMPKQNIIQYINSVLSGLEQNHELFL